MVKILYTGDINPCTVRVRSGLISGWNTGEIKDLEEADANCLLVQEYFILADGSTVGVLKEEILEPEEKPSEELEEEIPVEEELDEEVFDVDNALKDELLDYTAQHGIDADYSNTVKELREMINEYMLQ